MKTFLGAMLLLCIVGLSVGCHSGLMRGVGSDVSSLGENMQK